MALPVLITTYPADNDTGIPVGVTLKLYFSTGLDEKSVKDSIVLYGRDSDFTSGPETAIWVDKDSGDNPFFLASPGFKGLLPLKIELKYYTLGTETEVDPGVITSQADEVSANIGHLVKVSLDPKYNTVFPADTELKLIIAGDPDAQNIGISKRTVFDVIPDNANISSGSPSIWGTWENPTAGANEINIVIADSGSPNVATYRWWYTSAGISSASDKILTSRRYRSLTDGLQIRFSGSSLQSGDKWTFNLETKELLATNTVVTFSTNDGSYTVAPVSPSTPATTEPPVDIFPAYNTAFEVTSMTPESGSYNVPTKNRKIIIKFSEDIDSDTINNQSVRLLLYPVNGIYEDSFYPIELQKTLEVDASNLIIRF